MSDGHRQARGGIESWLDGARDAGPRSLLLVAPAAASAATEIAAEIASDCAARFAGCRIEQLDAAAPLQTGSGPRYELVIALGLEQLPLQASLPLLARLRDLHTAGHLLVLLDDHRQALAAELPALGLRRLAAPPEPMPAAACYQFSLRDYKPVPDWLNARFWANPERWGRARW